MTNLKRTDSTNIDFIKLVALLDKDLSIRDGDDHAFYDQFNKIENIKNVVVCYINEQAAGCGAFKEYDEKTVEIKRMFIPEAFRRQGLAQLILNELESWAATLGYSNAVLETGKKQPEAISLYKKAGYVITENYGQYEAMENSVCMKKELS